MTRRDALALLSDAHELFVARGKRVVHLDLRKHRPPDAELLALVLGPTGKLRAPTLRRGRTLIVGFDEPTYRQALG